MLQAERPLSLFATLFSQSSISKILSASFNSSIFFHNLLQIIWFACPFNYRLLYSQYLISPLEYGMKNIPVDLSTFSKLMHEGYLYIDKTEQIFNLLKGGERYSFLSRPRRFGKTLLLSTLKSLFSGDKELFKNLWIGKYSNYHWQTYPFNFTILSALLYLL